MQREHLANRRKLGEQFERGRYVKFQICQHARLLLGSRELAGEALGKDYIYLVESTKLALFATRITSQRCANFVSLAPRPAPHK